MSYYQDSWSIREKKNWWPRLFCTTNLYSSISGYLNTYPVWILASRILPKKMSHLESLQWPCFGLPLWSPPCSELGWVNFCILYWRGMWHNGNCTTILSKGDLTEALVSSFSRNSYGFWAYWHCHIITFLLCKFYVWVGTKSTPLTPTNLKSRCTLNWV